MSEIRPVTYSYIQEKDGRASVISDEAFSVSISILFFTKSERENLEKLAENNGKTCC